MAEQELSKYIRDVPDFPKPGILFRDITPLLQNPQAFEATLVRLEAVARELVPDVIAGVESRGFLFGAPLANRLDRPFVPIRKPGKLPAETVSETYSLEYGEDRLELHRDAVCEGARVLVIDDLLATGGTAAASVRLFAQLGAEVCGLAFVIELAFLGGRERLGALPVRSLVSYG